jgi:hypothetical protein
MEDLIRRCFSSPPSNSFLIRVPRRDSIFVIAGGLFDGHEIAPVLLEGLSKNGRPEAVPTSPFKQKETNQHEP